MTKAHRIIVVDDEQSARDMVGEYLSLHGFEVTLCDGGAALRQSLQTVKPDLVVLDLNMPREDGLSVIRFLKESCPVPVIMLTASASTIDRVVGLELGADDYLAKPCELRELLARIRSVLRRLKFSPARLPERRLAAIVSFDIVGFSRYIQDDEPGTLAAIDALFGGVISPSLVQAHGTLFKMLGDGALVEFLSIVDAAAWAIDLQCELATTPLSWSRGGRLVFRVGVAVGDIVVNHTDRVGEGVTLAVRVQECAAPGGVALSDQAFQLIRGKTSEKFFDGGMRQLKGINAPMRIWTWCNGEGRG